MYPFLYFCFDGEYTLSTALNTSGKWSQNSGCKKTAPSKPGKFNPFQITSNEKTLYTNNNQPTDFLLS